MVCKEAITHERRADQCVWVWCKKIQILFGEAKQDEKAAKISAWKAGMWLKSHWKNIDVKKLEIT